MKAITRISLVILFGALAHFSGAAAETDLKVGIQTWTLRNMNFDQVVDFAVKHEVKYLEMIDKHMNPKAPPEETKRKKAILDKNGLTCYTFGVAGTSGKKDDNRKLFELPNLWGSSSLLLSPRT